MWMPKWLLYIFYKYFQDENKIVHFRAKHRFLAFCKQTLMAQRTLCNKVNIHQIYIHHFFFLISGMQTCSQHSVVFPTLNYLMCLIISDLLYLYALEKFLSRKVRDHTPYQGNWLVA